MIEEKNEVWDRLRKAPLKFLWLRVTLFMVLMVSTIWWFARDQSYISKQADSIIGGIGFSLACAVGLWGYFDILIFWKPWTKTKRKVESRVEKQSGRVLLKEEELIWQDDAGRTIGTIPLSKVKVIAEYTTSDGPYADDWFYLFIISQNDLRQVSAYSANINSVLEYLSSKYNCDIVGHLAHSTTFDSNILWPERLRETKVYEILAEPKPTTIWQRLMTTFGLASEVGLTTDLKKYLG